MATQTLVTLIDSLNGKTEGVETVTFFHPMTGQKMTIELDAQNRKAMGTHLERMSKYFDAAEPVVEATPRKATKASADKGELALIREWAKANGYPIGDRGRIKADIVEAYRSAQAQPAPDAEVVQDLVLPSTEDAQKVDEDEASAPEIQLSEDDMNDVILAAMAELEVEGNEVSLDNLKDKVDSVAASN